MAARLGWRRDLEDCAVAARGVGAERFKGYPDNTDIGKALLDLLR